MSPATAPRPLPEEPDETAVPGPLHGLLAPRRSTVRAVEDVPSPEGNPPDARTAHTTGEPIQEEDTVARSGTRPTRPAETARPPESPGAAPARVPRRRARPARVRDRKDVDLLLLAVASEGVASGREFIDLVRERSAGAFELTERSVYHQLHRLRNDRLIRDTGRGGAGRFVLTSLGERILAARVRDWEAFSRGVDRVLFPGDGQRDR
ncbi:DNA-binding PadR family transcriptional regulator [Pseudonocardia sediminis]|uniref:DNA-binding PadR family transcriptional regulator n=1 Tax=Pseudonocardia sediminis TaxID=1397368 RepID=A0A4Q7UXV7_PSEST|nr:PadR family transcriptional regulator [Pseudonocardia sediminis]RZT86872.1 DNA-binding PadR family transcriptional regulator [Pseudonocardia sediminis]